MTCLSLTQPGLPKQRRAPPASAGAPARSAPSGVGGTGAPRAAARLCVARAGLTAAETPSARLPASVRRARRSARTEAAPGGPSGGAHTRRCPHLSSDRGPRPDSGPEKPVGAPGRLPRPAASLASGGPAGTRQRARSRAVGSRAPRAGGERRAPAFGLPCSGAGAGAGAESEAAPGVQPQDERTGGTLLRSSLKYLLRPRLCSYRHSPAAPSAPSGTRGTPTA